MSHKQACTHAGQAGRQHVLGECGLLHVSHGPRENAGYSGRAGWKAKLGTGLRVVLPVLEMFHDAPRVHENVMLRGKRASSGWRSVAAQQRVPKRVACAVVVCGGAWQ